MATARALALRAALDLEKGRITRLKQTLDRGRLPPREMALAFELAHGAVRNDRLLDCVLLELLPRGLPSDPLLRVCLRLGAYQLLFVSGMPAHAAVNETVALARRNKPLINAVLRRLSAQVALEPAAPDRPFEQIALSPTRSLRLPPPGLRRHGDALAIRHSLPDFLVDRWRARFTAAELAQICAAASTVPAVFLRAVAPHDRLQVRERLAGEGVECAVDDHPAMLRWTGGNSPFGGKAFAEGLFVVQDPTSLGAVEAVAAAPGMTVVDLCAAPGTKTMLLAERVRPDGRVFAYDVDGVRRERILDNARRLRLERHVQVCADPTQLPIADAVLADVPCSNTGVLGRRVEVHRRLTPGTFAELASVQAGLLRQAAALVRPGGHLVYSTCSIEADENELLVQSALPPGFRLAGSALTLPLAGRCDGGYWARLERAAD